MYNLVQFLRDRLDEDAELARQAAEAGPLAQWDHTSDALLGEALATRRRLADRGVPGVLDDAAHAHAARHDPARVLREIDARQKLVNAAVAAKFDYDFVRAPSRTWADRAEQVVAHAQTEARWAAWAYVLAQLAESYADRPGYREEWRP